MKEFNRLTPDVDYHPDDTPGYFLNKKLLSDLLNIVESKAKTKKDYDTIEFIRKHEQSQIDLAEGTITSKSQKEFIDKIANEFLEKHKDWVHHANRIYDEFYRQVLLIAKNYG